MTPRVAPLSKSTPGNPAIVVFPHAGGSPRYFAPWCRQLPENVDLFGVTYPGRDTLLDDPAPATLLELASACATAVEPIIRSPGPVVMFGHSMGAYIAFETTRSLERAGMTVTSLVVSAADAPHFGTDDAWHRASDDDLVEQIGDLDARSREVLAVPELRQMFLPTIRDDYRLVENYRARPEPQVSCPLYIFYGESDPDVTAARATPWADYTSADSAVRSFPGDHFYVSAHTAEVVAHLAGILESHRARSRTIRARSMP